MASTLTLKRSPLRRRRNKVTTKTCIHHWIVETPNGPFSLAKCKKCGEYDAVKNFMGEHTCTQKEAKGTVPNDTERERMVFFKEKVQEDRNRLSEKRKRSVTKKKSVRIITKHEDISKINALIDLAKGISIKETSKKHDIPSSTLHDWKKIYSDYEKVKTSGNVEILKLILVEKIKIEKNVSKIAQNYNVPRRTLRGWVEKQK